MNTPGSDSGPIPVPFPAREYTRLHGLRGISDPLISAHLGLYEGYVKNVNLLRKRIHESAVGSPEWCEMQRRMGFELAGLRLHELYFDGLSPRAAPIPEPLERRLAGVWGSYRRWRAEFEALAQMRGAGWVILYRDPATGRLSNHWIESHDEGHPPGFAPLLVLDVWEHAYSGMTRSAYVEAFFSNIEWSRIESR